MVSVLVREGDVIAANDGVLEVETDKAVVEIPCPHAGKISKVCVAKGQTVKVGESLLSVETESAEAEVAIAAPPAKPQADASAKLQAAAAEPAAAKEVVRGAGSPPAGPRAWRRFVTRAKAAAAVAESLPRTSAPRRRKWRRRLPPERAEPSEAPSVGVPAQRGSAASRPCRRAFWAKTPTATSAASRCRGIRRTIAAQMTKSASTIPHVTNFDDADVTELERLRKTIPAAYLGPTVKLTAMPFAMKAIAMALRQHPLLNASLDDEKGEIVYKQYVNLGVAVDTPRGLVVPVIRNADRLGIVDLARELTLLAARALGGVRRR